MSTKAKSVTTSTRKQTRRHYTAQEKCQAVLAIWTERRSMAQVGKDLQVSWSQLHVWQDQALSGMLQALEPKTKATDRPSPLSVKLQKLLAKRGLVEQVSGTASASLQKRLAEVQDTQKQTP